jgi:lipopolysaccharide export system protein LptA
MNKIKGLIVILLSIVSTTINSQNQIEYRSDYGRVYPENPNDIVLVKNVVFTHKEMTMYCDSAIYNQKENFFDAYNNVRMYQGDSVSLFGDVLHYDGNTKIGELDGNKVVMKDDDVTLVTDYLILDRNVNTVSYFSFSVIYNDKDTLRSKEGVYFIDDEKCSFYHSVHLTSKDGYLRSDSLFYDTKTNDGEFFGEHAHLIVYEDSIKTDSSVVVSQYGKYNSKTEEIYSNTHPLIFTKSKFITGDTIYYDKKNKNGYAYNNIYIEDTVEKTFLDCNSIYLTTVDTISTAIISDRLLFRQVDKDDTLYMHSDTIEVVMDTSFEIKQLFAYEHCKLYRTDMQGACEYLHYNRSDSSVTLLVRPVIWAEQSQMTADTIILFTDEKNIKTMYMQPNTFIVQNSDTNTSEFFNQVSGKNLVGYFEKNKIYYAEIDGNTRCIYYIWDENKKQKTKKLTGVNIGLSKQLHLYFDKGELNKMSAIKDAEFYMDNLKNIPLDDRQLKGFIYLENDRPKTPLDVFLRRK